MVRQVIVVGDTLAPHGGAITTGSNADVVEGKAIARKGDTVVCHEHGTQAIAEGDVNGMIAGAPVALHGHRATCGCTLISRSVTVSWS